MKTNLKFLYLVLTAVVLFSFLGSCNDLLNQREQGFLYGDQITAEGLVLAAYGAFAHDTYTYPFSLWPYGNVRSDDAYKGGRDNSDIVAYHNLEISSGIQTSQTQHDQLFFRLYCAISRANAAINMLEQEKPIRTNRIGEMKFLRGHSYFLLKVLFKHIPYVNESVDRNYYAEISNVNFTDDELWEKIAEDFSYAYSYLPDMQQEIGRPTKYTAAAHLAKVMLYKAYRQDEKHNVIAIDPLDLEEVLTYTEIALSGPQYGLESDFGYNFLPGKYQNGKESFFSIQMELNYAEELSAPQYVGCCDFQKPSQNLVNAYRTSYGLPLFDNYNSKNFASADPVDPRLFHTVAVPGFPYKYTKKVFQNSWSRSPNIYGNFTSLKENVDPDCSCLVQKGAFYPNSKNRIVIRYADVLLMRAEALIELGREQEALPLINQIRERAKNSLTLLSDYNANFSIDTYKNGYNCIWDNDFARKALRWERRLEMAMEGTRFFDLVRWGVADSVINKFYIEEATRRSYYLGASFQKNKHEYLPIPQQQVNFSQGLYKQNYSW